MGTVQRGHGRVFGGNHAAGGARVFDSPRDHRILARTGSSQTLGFHRHWVLEHTGSSQALGPRKHWVPTGIASSQALDPHNYWVLTSAVSSQASAHGLDPTMRTDCLLVPHKRWLARSPCAHGRVQKPHKFNFAKQIVGYRCRCKSSSKCLRA